MNKFAVELLSLEEMAMVLGGKTTYTLRLVKNDGTVVKRTVTFEDNGDMKVDDEIIEHP